MDFFWLIVPVDFYLRFNIIQKRYILTSQKTCLFFKKTRKIYGNIFEGAWVYQNNQTQKVFKRSKKIKTIINDGGNQFSNIPNNIPVKKT